MSGKSRLFYKPRKAGRTRKSARAAVPWLFCAPSLLGLGIFTLFPFLDAVRRGFTDAMGARFVGLKNFASVLDQLGICRVDGILLDVGVSSYQIDTVERGFTYKADAPLDMRMDTRSRLTARTIVNEYDEAALFCLIRDYGEDSFAKNIARHIVRAREKTPIETTGQLVEIICAAIPAKIRNKGGHPAKKTFQALRIECNQELRVLEDSIDGMIAIEQ